MDFDSSCGTSNCCQPDHSQSHLFCKGGRRPLGFVVGAPCWLAPQCGRSRLHWSPATLSQVLEAVHEVLREDMFYSGFFLLFCGDSSIAPSSAVGKKKP